MAKLKASIGRRTSDGTAATAALEIISGTNKGSWLRRLSITLVAATTSVYGLGRPAVKGVTPTTPVTSLLATPGEGAPSITTAVAWGTGPTVPAQFFRRASFAAVIGELIVWDINIYIASGTTLVLWNIGSNSLADVYVVTVEQQ